MGVANRRAARGVGQAPIGGERRGARVRRPGKPGRDGSENDDQNFRLSRSVAIPIGRGKTQRNVGRHDFSTIRPRIASGRLPRGHREALQWSWRGRPPTRRRTVARHQENRHADLPSRAPIDTPLCSPGRSTATGRRRPGRTGRAAAAPAGPMAARAPRATRRRGTETRGRRGRRLAGSAPRDRQASPSWDRRRLAGSAPRSGLHGVVRSISIVHPGRAFASS